jgi:hypothetical protein
MSYSEFITCPNTKITTSTSRSTKQKHRHKRM